MSASSRPTRNPRSRKASARLRAVVDLPTPPLPDATAITAATPGISDCFAIGEAGLCGGRCEETGCTPGACRCGGGAAGEPGLRSAVRAIMAALTPGIARTAASACARTLSQARASAASTLTEKNTLSSLTVMADKTSASVKATPRGDLTLARTSRTCCCLTLNAYLPHSSRTDSAISRESIPPCSVGSGLRGPARHCSALFVRSFIVEFDQHPVGVVDENLPEIATRDLASIVFHAFGLKPLLHPRKTLARKSDMVDNTGIRLLLLIRWRNIHQMDDRFAFAVHPCAGECEVWAGALLQPQNIFIEPDCFRQLAGADVEVVEHAYAHAHASLLRCLGISCDPRPA